MFSFSAETFKMIEFLGLKVPKLTLTLIGLVLKWFSRQSSKISLGFLYENGKMSKFHCVF